MKQTDPQFKLRLPEELKVRIEAAAEEAKRSMNAEIVDRLESSFHDNSSLRLEEAERVVGVFMAFFTAAITSAQKVVERLPAEEQNEFIPAAIIKLMHHLFMGKGDSVEGFRILQALGPVLGLQSDGRTIEEKAANVDKLLERLKKTDYVQKNVGFLTHIINERDQVRGESGEDLSAKKEPTDTVRTSRKKVGAKKTAS
jgi:hypothetical protein